MVKLFVEGGGLQNWSLNAECRKGFRQFLEKAGLGGHMPQIVASGARQVAYEDFCTAIANNEAALLLVDSEAPIAANDQPPNVKDWQPWRHLANVADDKWKKPKGATNEHCHLMVECMENWFLADREALIAFFGQGFLVAKLPHAAILVEEVSKGQVISALGAASRKCKTKDPYDKGKHSFDLLGRIDPSKVVAASPWAKRFVDETKRQMGC